MPTLCTARPSARYSNRSVVAHAASQEVSESKSSMPAEFGSLFLRLTTCSMFVHHGLEKLADPEGFATFVVAKYLSFLPAPLFWTYAAAYVQILCPVVLLLGLPKGLSRLSALALTGTMFFAMIFHFNASGLEGFPLGIVENHNYEFEAAGLLGAASVYFTLAGPGKLSVAGLLAKKD